MKIIAVSDETKRLIDEQALPGYAIRQTATRLSDGGWTNPIDDEVFRHIDSADYMARRITIRLADCCASRSAGGQVRPLPLGEHP